MDALWWNHGAGAFSGWNVIWYMEGESIGSSGYLYEITNIDWKIAGTGDFDRDGQLEILWRNCGTGPNSGWNCIWYMQGETTGYDYPTLIPDANRRIVNRCFQEVECADVT